MDDVGEDIVHAGVSTAAVGHDRPPEDGDDAVSEFVDLLDVRGEEDDDHSGLRELLELAIDFGPGADVDAAGRLLFRSSTRGSSATALAMATFCWLPPLRCETSLGRRLGSMVKRPARCRARSLAFPNCRNPNRVTRSSTEVVMLVSTVASRKTPLRRGPREHRRCPVRSPERCSGFDIDAVDLDGADVASTQARERFDDDVGAGAELTHDRDDLALSDLQIERSEAARNGEALEPDARRPLHLVGVVGDLLAGGDLAADHRANESSV